MSFGALKGTLVGAATSVTNPLDATGSVTVAAGDLIVVVYAELTSNTLSGVTDNLGNSYTAQNAGSAATAAGRAFWSRATVSGVLTAVHAATTASADDAAIVVGVFDQGQNGFAASPLDTSPANTTGDVTSAFTCPLTGTLAQASELVVGWMALTRGQTNTAATAPFSLAANNPSGTANAASSVCAALAYQAVAVTTSIQANFTCASGTFNGSVVGTMSFKEAGVLPFRQNDWPRPLAWDDRQKLVIANREWSFPGNALYLGVPPADTTRILRAPLYTRIEPINPGAAIRATSENPAQPLTLKPLTNPFVQADWPVPKAVAGQAPSQHPNPLTGPLAGKDARLIGQAAIAPNPTGATPSIALLTHLQPLNLLAGQDARVTGQSAISSNPIGATPSIVLRTHIQPLNLLAGQDTMVPGKTATEPNPTSATRSIALRTHLQSLNVLAGQDAMVPGQAAISPNPIAATPSIGLRTHLQPLNILAGQDATAPGKAAIDPNPRTPPPPVIRDPPNLLEATLQPLAPAPFSPPDWINQTARPIARAPVDPPNLLQTTLGPNTYILRGAQVTRYERASYGAALREPGSASLALLAPVQPPFVQADWPNTAQQPARASFDAKTAQALTDIKPFAQSEWTNPRAPVTTATADPANLLEATLQPLAAPPFLPPDWPNPAARSVAAALFDPPNLLPTALGPNTYILRGPQVTRYERANYDAALRESGSSSLAVLAPVAPPSPFSPIDLPVPKGAVPLTHGVAPLDLLNTTLAGQGAAPFAQTDWPVPRGAIPVVTLRVNIPQQTIYVPPGSFAFRAASQFKYQGPRGWRAALDALSLGTNLELLGGPPPPPPTLPPNCYDWPNPRGPAYPTSLRTFTDPLKRNLLGQDSMFGDPGQVPGYSSPQPRDAGDYQLEISTGIPLSLLAGILPAPFNQTDWRLPAGPAASRQDPQAATSLALSQTPPFNRTDWPNPRGYEPRQAFAHNPSFILGAPALKPFGQGDWPNPLPPRIGNQYLAHNTSFSLITQGPPPFAQNAWPNPLPRQRSNPDHVTQDLTAVLPPPVVSADIPWSGFIANMGRMMGRRG